MNLLNESIDSKFLIRKWNIVNDQSNVHYDTASVIIYNTEVVKSNLWDYNDTYISLMDHNTVVSESQKLMEQKHIILNT